MEKNLDTIEQIISAMKHSQSSLRDHVINDEKNKSGNYPDQYALQRAMQSLNLHVASQMWSNTSCGWGGIAGQAFTSCNVITMYSKSIGVAYVYIAGRFAYSAACSDTFIKCMTGSALPGWADVEVGLYAPRNGTDGFEILSKKIIHR